MVVNIEDAQGRETSLHMLLCLITCFTLLGMKGVTFFKLRAKEKLPMDQVYNVSTAPQINTFPSASAYHKSLLRKRKGVAINGGFCLQVEIIKESRNLLAVPKI